MPTTTPFIALLTALSVVSATLDLGAQGVRPARASTPEPATGVSGKYGERARGRAQLSLTAPPAAAAIESGLAWLGSVQGPDGGWDAARFAARDGTVPPADEATHTNRNIIVTALALHAFMGDGNTLRAGTHRDVVKRGIIWLRERQSDAGGFGDPAAANFVHAQAIATLAMIEAHHLSDYKMLRRNARNGLIHLTGFRHTDGGWKSTADARTSEPSLALWGVLAHATGDDAGPSIAPDWRTAAALHLETLESQLTGGSHMLGPVGTPVGTVERASIARDASAIALCARRFAGQQTFATAADKRAVAVLAGNPPRWSKAGDMDHFAWFCASHALYQHGGRPWQQWSQAMRDTLVDHQRKDADLVGSWDPDGVWGKTAGRIYATAILTLTLESGYRFSRHGFAPTSRPETAPPHKALRVKIVCTREGEQVPRVAGDAEAGYRLVDHEIRWAIGPSRINTIGDFGQRLRLLIHDPARRVRGLDGTFQQMPVEFEAAAFAVYYGDVVATMDAALDAGVLRLQLLEGCVVSLRAVTEPTAYGRDLMPPEARFCEPDDAPPTWRPVLRIDQRGRVFDGATLLHDPAKQADDLRRVDEGLAGFRQQAEARSLIETVETGGGKSVRITAPIMLVGDRWTDWHHLRRVAERATRAGFWKVHLAVVKIDLEAATRPAPQRKK